MFPRRRTYGYRLDHAFCTPPLAERLVACRYSHAEREAGVSDHSVMLIDLAAPELRLTQRTTTVPSSSSGSPSCR